MATFLMTWNPKDQWVWDQDEYDLAVEVTAAGTVWPDQWSTGVRKAGIAKGDRAFLCRLRIERGIVASGTFTTSIFTAPHWDGSSRQARYAKINFDTILPIEDRLPVAELNRRIPAVSWDRLQGSGVLVPAGTEPALERVWAQHLATTPYRAPGEESPKTFYEGAVTRIEVNRYERDRDARKTCIRHHGTTCAVCGFDFKKRYGTIGRGFVHIHHLREISTIGPDYELDPVRELIPLCANCHAMAHRKRPAYTPSELRARLRKS